MFRLHARSGAAPLPGLFVHDTPPSGIGVFVHQGKAVAFVQVPRTMEFGQGGQPERFVMYTGEIHGMGQEGAADALTVICRGNDKPPQARFLRCSTVDDNTAHKVVLGARRQEQIARFGMPRRKFGDFASDFALKRKPKLHQICVVVGLGLNHPTQETCLITGVVCIHVWLCFTFGGLHQFGERATALIGRLLQLRTHADTIGHGAVLTELEFAFECVDVHAVGHNPLKHVPHFIHGVPGVFVVIKLRQPVEHGHRIVVVADCLGHTGGMHHGVVPCRHGSGAFVPAWRDKGVWTMKNGRNGDAVLDEPVVRVGACKMEFKRDGGVIMTDHDGRVADLRSAVWAIADEGGEVVLLHERQHGGAVRHAVGHWDVDGHNKASYVVENDAFIV